MHDASGRVTLPGFYDGVRPASDRERRALAGAGTPQAEFYRNAGVRRGFGEEGFTPYERTTIRPALVVTGVYGGDPRPGGAGIVPARARANVNVRLAPDQDPDRVTEALRRYVASRVPPTVRVSVRSRGGSRAVLVDPGHPAFRAAAVAVRRAFGVDPVLLRCGGTIPVVGHLRDVLGIPAVLFGMTRPTDGQHGPDERFHLSDLRRGTAAVAGFLAAAAHLPRRAEIP
jgi:acetylornithine deacetylase/succinyl-diaminopimelate desuccinylase-like protein